MRKIIIILSVFALMTGSCGNRTTKQTSNEIDAEQINEEEQYVSIIPPIQFDWEKVIALKNSTIKELKKKEKTNDKIIMNFLNKYAKLVDEFNEILFKYEGYDSLCNLLYMEIKRNDQFFDTEIHYDLDLKNEVESNGFKLIFPEGTLEITQNTDFIKSGILSLVDAVSIEFINLYCNEFDNRCCEDAGIIISKEELVNRVYKWGELSKKVGKLEYKKLVEDEFYSNLSLLFFGIDNTLAFDRETKKYDEESINLMNKIIEKNPASRAAEEFKPFVELLENEDFEETKKVKEFLTKKFNIKYIN
jgi:hypothetical protein